MEVLRVSRGLAIPVDELSWRFSSSGGPGGQHANTSNTRVELLFDVAGSPSLGPRQRARLLEKLGPVVRVVASDERANPKEDHLEHVSRPVWSDNQDLRLDRRRDRGRPPQSDARPRAADLRR